MDISDLVKQLSQLQLEQNKIIEQILAARVTATPTEPEDMIHIGDHVLLKQAASGVSKEIEPELLRLLTQPYISP